MTMRRQSAHPVKNSHQPAASATVASPSPKLVRTSPTLRSVRITSVWSGRRCGSVLDPGLLSCSRTAVPDVGFSPSSSTSAHRAFAVKLTRTSALAAECPWTAKFHALAPPSQEVASVPCLRFRIAVSEGGCSSTSSLSRPRGRSGYGTSNNMGSHAGSRTPSQAGSNGNNGYHGHTLLAAGGRTCCLVTGLCNQAAIPQEGANGYRGHAFLASLRPWTWRLQPLPLYIFSEADSTPSSCSPAPRTSRAHNGQMDSTAHQTGSSK
jgi:hypothetical protein